MSVAGQQIAFAKMTKEELLRRLTEEFTEKLTLKADLKLAVEVIEEAINFATYRDIEDGHDLIGSLQQTLKTLKGKEEEDGAKR